MRQRDGKSQAVEGVAGGALQQRCQSCTLSLIGCFAIRTLRDEDELASYRPGMLYKVSQEVSWRQERVRRPPVWL